MNRLFFSALLAAALSACAPGPAGVDGSPGVVGVQGSVGDQGATGVQGLAGADGIDLPKRDGRIVSIGTAQVVAGASATFTVRGEYTEWVEAPVIITEYDGVTVSTAVTSPVTMVVTISADADVRGGEALLLRDGETFGAPVPVVPAARFALDEGQSNPVRPGQSFSGTIIFAPGFGLRGSSQIVPQENVNAVIWRGFRVESTDFGTVAAIHCEGAIAANAASGVIHLNIVTNSGAQTIPVWRAIEVADQPAETLTQEQSIETSLESGFGLFLLSAGQGGLVTGGSIIRAEILDADFPALIEVAVLGDRNADPPLPAFRVVNTDVQMGNVTTNAIEWIAPRTGVYFMTVSHADNERSADFTYTASFTQVPLQVADGQEHEVPLTRPGHSGWFAREITPGQTLFTTLISSGNEAADPAMRIYFSYRTEDGRDVHGAQIRFGQDIFVFNNTNRYLGYFGAGITWPGSLPNALIYYRLSDEAMRGGPGYQLTFNGGVR